MGIYITDEEGVKPEKPNAGERSLYPKADGWYELDDQNIETALTQPIFGRNNELSLSENYTMSTSGTTWDTYAGLQIPTGKGGKYLVFASFYCRMNNTGRDAYARVSINGSTEGLEMKEELKDSSAVEQVPRVLMKIVSVSDGDYIDLDFATEDSSSTITVKEAIIALWRVD